jgi:TRAP-type mannitol/chloroaromatic compound transport system substrate-binding protein
VQGRDGSLFEALVPYIAPPGIGCCGKRWRVIECYRSDGIGTPERHRAEAAVMRRRDILAGAGSLAGGATLSFPAPAIAQGIRQLKMVTDWPEATPGFHTSAVRLAQTIGLATGGRIKIEVFPAGALVRPFETFDEVGAGVADMYHTYIGFFEKKSPAFQFFATSGN